MNEKIEALLKGYREEMMQTVQSWVQIPSVKGADTAPGAPFGSNVRKALDKAMADAEKMGFATQIVDGYAGHAEMGEGSDIDALAILAHLDVVPMGDGWTKQPFGGERMEGKIYGRGTADDKGPAVAALYAMRAVKEAGIPLKRKVRLILGCDEECGMQDMNYYAAHVTMPRCGFSPDADYPVINIEKGGCHIKLTGKPAGEGLRVLSMHVGERANVVPGIASAVIEGDAETAQTLLNAAKELGFPAEVKMEKGALKLTTTGVTGHAAFPEHGRNAIGQMLLILRAAGVQGCFKELADTVGMTCFGEKLGIAMEDGISGKLTCSLDILNADEDELEAVMDIRYPVMMNADVMLKLIRMRLKTLNAVMESHREPHHVSAESELVQELLNAYHEVTGGEKKALAIGGGTYAHCMEEGVAFGAVFPGETDMCHQADEFISEESLFQSTRIFAEAIVRLAQAD